MNERKKKLHQLSININKIERKKLELNLCLAIFGTMVLRCSHLHTLWDIIWWVRLNDSNFSLSADWCGCFCCYFLCINTFHFSLFVMVMCALLYNRNKWNSSLFFCLPHSLLIYYFGSPNWTDSFLFLMIVAIFSSMNFKTFSVIVVIVSNTNIASHAVEVEFWLFFEPILPHRRSYIECWI